MVASRQAARRRERHPYPSERPASGNCLKSRFAEPSQNRGRRPVLPSVMRIPRASLRIERLSSKAMIDYIHLGINFNTLKPLALGIAFGDPLRSAQPSQQPGLHRIPRKSAQRRWFTHLSRLLKKPRVRLENGFVAVAISAFAQLYGRNSSVLTNRERRESNACREAGLYIHCITCG